MIDVFVNIVRYILRRWDETQEITLYCYPLYYLKRTVLP